MKATGTLKHQRGAANIEQEMCTLVTADKFEFNVLSFRATGGREQSRVEGAVREQTGLTHGKRSARAHARSLQRTQNFNYVPFIIYAEDTTSQGQKQFQFDKPLPVPTEFFHLPAKRSFI